MWDREEVVVAGPMDGAPHLRELVSAEMIPNVGGKGHPVSDGVIFHSSGSRKWVTLERPRMTPVHS